jgi:hypothetical protein
MKTRSNAGHLVRLRRLSDDIEHASHEVGRLNGLLREARRQRRRLIAERRRLVRSANARGIPAASLARACGMTRQGIHVILDEQRIEGR